MVDLLLSTASTEYFLSLQLYHRVLRERNALLKKGGGDRELDAFEQALIPSDFEFGNASRRLPKISVLLSESYAALSSKKEESDLAYKPDLLLESEQEWAKRLVEERAKDRIMGNTRRGPHRDDFTFLCNGKDARTFASEGQQRGLVLALRFAEFFFVRQVRDQTPLILADDVLGELDDERRQTSSNCSPRKQVFATGTSFPSPGSGQMGNFPVSSGTFESWLFNRSKFCHVLPRASY